MYPLSPAPAEPNSTRGLSGHEKHGFDRRVKCQRAPVLSVIKTPNKQTTPCRLNNTNIDPGCLVYMVGIQVTPVTTMQPHTQAKRRTRLLLRDLSGLFLIYAIICLVAISIRGVLALLASCGWRGGDTAQTDGLAAPAKAPGGKAEKGDDAVAMEVADGSGDEGEGLGSLGEEDSGAELGGEGKGGGGGGESKEWDVRGELQAELRAAIDRLASVTDQLVVVSDSRKQEQQPMSIPLLVDQTYMQTARPVAGDIACIFSGMYSHHPHARKWGLPITSPKG